MEAAEAEARVFSFMVAIHVVQGKTGAKLWIPLHPALGQVLCAWSKDDGAILHTNYGKDFTSKGFSNFMADKIGEAGLPDRCVTHGLRKAAARRLAEAGCSANEIASITGHATLKEVERYTKAAEQRKLAVSAMGRLQLPVPAGEFPNPSKSLGIMAGKGREIRLARGGFDSPRVN